MYGVNRMQDLTLKYYYITMKSRQSKPIEQSYSVYYDRLRKHYSKFFFQKFFAIFYLNYLIDQDFEVIFSQKNMIVQMNCMSFVLVLCLKISNVKFLCNFNTGCNNVLRYTNRYYLPESPECSTRYNTQIKALFRVLVRLFECCSGYWGFR